jgi:hypothetical protein
MAKAKLNPILEQLHGGMGDLVFRRTPGGGVTVMHRPDMSGVKWSPAQVAGRERFRQAVQYARLTLADPQKRIPYDEVAHKRGRRAYGLMLTDFMNLPVVDGVDLTGYAGAAGDRITILAHDDFGVTQVRVCISTMQGREIESGLATEQPAGNGQWSYRATIPLPAGTQVHITVTARDRPGGQAMMEVKKIL